jgi:hypothetical protein
MRVRQTDKVTQSGILSRLVGGHHWADHAVIITKPYYQSAAGPGEHNVQVFLVGPRGTLKWVLYCKSLMGIIEGLKWHGVATI